MSAEINSEVTARENIRNVLDTWGDIPVGDLQFTQILITWDIQVVNYLKKNFSLILP